MTADPERFNSTAAPARHLRQVPRRHPREDQQAGSSDPRHQHRVRHREPERPGDLQRVLCQTVLGRFRERETEGVKHETSD